MLKFKERDDMEFTFQFWKDAKKQFDLCGLWDMRLRRFYGHRYDARENLSDWDYHMKLTDKKQKVLYNIKVKDGYYS